MVMGLGGKMRLKKVGLVNVLPGYAPLKTLVSDNLELDILAPLVMLNEDELNRELQLSMEIPHAVCNEHELLLFSNVNGEKKLLHRIPEGEVIEGLFIDQQPADCHAQHDSLAMPVTSASGGRAIFAAIAAEGHVRALIAEAAVDDGTRYWSADEYKLLPVACVHTSWGRKLTIIVQFLYKTLGDKRFLQCLLPYKTCTILVQTLYRYCTSFVQGLYKLCTRIVQALYKDCTSSVQGLYYLRTRILQESYIYRAIFNDRPAHPAR